MRNEVPTFMVVHEDDCTLIWNQSWGWMDTEFDEESEISMFTETEKDNFNLPPEGKWELM